MLKIEIRGFDGAQVSGRDPVLLSRHLHGRFFRTGKVGLCARLTHDPHRFHIHRGCATMAAKIHVERMMHRSSIAVAGESAASYALIKLIPSGLGGASAPMPLNLALVLDVSGSMYEEDGTNIPRLKRVQDASIAAIQKLKPD